MQDLPKEAFYRLIRERFTLPTPRELASPIAQLTYVVLDLETTGGNPRHHRIMEFGAYKVRDLAIVDSMSMLINPGRPIPPFIQQLTGITNQMVEDAPSFSEAAPKLLEFINDAVVVAHHAPFDLKFLSWQLVEAGYQPITNPVLCTCRLARSLIPDGITSRGLDELIRALDLTIEGRHRALPDARAAAELLILFLTELIRRGLDSLDEVIRYQYRPVVEKKPAKPSHRALKDGELSIRPFHSDDIAHAFRWFTQPEVFRGYFPSWRELDYERVRRELERTSAYGRLFVIELEGRPVGLTCLRKLRMRSPRSGEVRLLIGEPEARGRGIGKRSLGMMLRYGFNFLHLRRVTGRVHPDIPAHRALVDRFGFRPLNRERPLRSGELTYVLGRESYLTLEREGLALLLPESVQGPHQAGRAASGPGSGHA